jgi:hypothetical protein
VVFFFLNQQVGGWKNKKQKKSPLLAKEKKDMGD